MGFFTTIFGLSDEEKAQQEVAAAQAEILARLEREHKVSTSEAARLREQAALLDVDGIAREEFFSEVETRATNPFKLFDFVPVWVWIVAALALAAYFGAFKKIKFKP